MDYTRQYPIYRIKGENINQEDDSIIVEYPFTIFIDDEEIITLLCTPKSLRHLALGFIYSEGFIDKMEDLDRLELDQENGRAYIYLKKRNKFNESFQGKRTITSGCGKGTVFYNVLDSLKSIKIETAVEIEIEKIKNFMRSFSRKSDLFLLTGGVHSCALYDINGILVFEEDIGRHNALDKILGKALEDGLDLSDKFILTSGRISSEIILKAAKRGIPLVVSRSAPTSLAIDIAKELNIGLVGFVRGEKLNIYSGSIPSSNS